MKPVTSDWFFLDEGGQKHGPLMLADLIAALVKCAQSRTTLVWRNGLDQWTEAGRVPEVVAELDAAEAFNYAKDGRSQGPVSPRQLAALIGRGQLPPDTLVWRPDLSGWTAASDVPQLTPALPRPLVERPGPSSSPGGTGTRRKRRSPVLGVVAALNIVVALLVLVGAVTSYLRFTRDPEYRRRSVRATAELLRAKMLDSGRISVQQALSLSGPIEKAIDFARVEDALQREVKKQLWTGVIVAPLMIVVGAGVMARWRPARVACVVIGVLSLLSAAVNAGRVILDSGSGTDWGAVAFLAGFGLLNTLGLRGWRREAESRAQDARVAAPRTVPPAKPKSPVPVPAKRQPEQEQGISLWRIGAFFLSMAVGLTLLVPVTLLIPRDVANPADLLRPIAIVLMFLCYASNRRLASFLRTSWARLSNPS